MAKKKTDAQDGTKIESKFNIDDFKKNIVSASHIRRPKKVITISPNLDMALGGGVPEGSFVILTGAQKLGKTTLALQLAANAQKLEFGNRKVYYADVEGRIKERDIDGIFGLDTSPENFIVIGSTEERLLYAHHYLDLALHFLKTQKNIVMIIDSVSQLCSEGRITESTGDRYRDDVPLMLASFTKQVANILPVTNNILVVITHIIANQGHGMSPTMEASGKKIQYQGDVKMKATYQTPYLVGDKQVGQEVHWVCEFSALGPPMQKCTTLLRYGIGLDKEYDMINMCLDVGLVDKGGSWLTIKDQKIQGMEKACAYLRDNPEIYKGLAADFAKLTS